MGTMGITGFVALLASGSHAVEPDTRTAGCDCKPKQERKNGFTLT